MRSRTAIALLTVVAVSLAACGQPRQLGNRVYPTHGLFNKSTSWSKNVCYEVSLGNVVWSIILVETVIAPVYFVGWSLWNPIRLKKSPNDQCGLDD